MDGRRVDGRRAAHGGRHKRVIVDADHSSKILAKLNRAKGGRKQEDVGERVIPEGRRIRVKWGGSLKGEDGSAGMLREWSAVGFCEVRC